VAKYFDVHPVNPQPRAVAQLVELLHTGAVIAYPTDSGYALGCSLENREGPARMRRIRGLDERHHFTFMCSDFAQLGQLAHLDNAPFRAIKAATPGSYTFILPAAPGVPRRLEDPKRRTVGVRIPDSPLVRALVAALGTPIVSSTLILPGESEPQSDGWQIKEELDHQVDAVVDAGDCLPEPTTVVDWSEGYPEVLRVGAGDPERFA
jgi:tRNA threonylcarbamoyl adenosine modification protein (Sua5/YciO/YrdC/YwlC family)